MSSPFFRIGDYLKLAHDCPPYRQGYYGKVVKICRPIFFSAGPEYLMEMEDGITARFGEDILDHAGFSITECSKLENKIDWVKTGF